MAFSSIFGRSKSHSNIDSRIRTGTIDEDLIETIDLANPDFKKALEILQKFSATEQAVILTQAAHPTLLEAALFARAQDASKLSIQCQDNINTTVNVPARSQINNITLYDDEAAAARATIPCENADDVQISSAVGSGGNDTRTQGEAPGEPVNTPWIDMELKIRKLQSEQKLIKEKFPEFNAGLVTPVGSSMPPPFNPQPLITPTAV